MKYLFIFSAVIMLALSPVFIMASDTSDAAYYGRIDIVNNGTAVTNGFVNLTLDSQVLIGDYYMWPNCTDSAIIGTTGADVAYMPAPNSTDTWLIWVPSIGENVTIQNTLYTGGNSPMLGDVRWFPGTGGAITSDASGIEMGNDFNLTIIGWFNTTNTGQSFAEKIGAFDACYEAGLNITVNITEGWVSPTSHNDISAVWSDEGNAYDDNTGTQAYTNTQNAYLELIPTSNVLCTQVRFWTTSTTWNWTIDAYYSGGWTNIHNATALASQWTYADIPDAPQTVEKVRVAYNGGGTPPAYFYELDFLNELIIKCQGVTPGDYAISLVADTTNLKIYKDYVEEGSVALSGIAVPNNGNDYQWAGNSTMPYVESIKLTVGGVTELIYDFTNFISDATVLDTGDTPADDGTVSFQTQASDPDLSADLVSFLPYDLSEASTTAVGAEAEMWDSAPDSIDQLYTEMNRNHLPGAGLIDDLLNNASIPLAVFWIPAAYGVSIVFGLGAYAMTRNLLVQAAVSAVVMGFHSFMTGGGIIPFWTVIVFVIEAIILVWTLRQRQVA